AGPPFAKIVEDHLSAFAFILAIDFQLRLPHGRACDVHPLPILRAREIEFADFEFCGRFGRYGAEGHNRHKQSNQLWTLNTSHENLLRVSSPKVEHIATPHTHARASSASLPRPLRLASANQIC